MEQRSCSSHLDSSNVSTAKILGENVLGSQIRTPRSQSRILVSPLDDGPLGNYGVRGKLLCDDVIRVDKIVSVARQRVDSGGEGSQNEQQGPTS